MRALVVSGINKEEDILLLLQEVKGIYLIRLVEVKKENMNITLTTKEKEEAGQRRDENM